MNAQEFVRTYEKIETETWRAKAFSDNSELFIKLSHTLQDTIKKYSETPNALFPFIRTIALLYNLYHEIEWIIIMKKDTNDTNKEITNDILYGINDYIQKCLKEIKEIGLLSRFDYAGISTEIYSAVKANTYPEAKKFVINPFFQIKEKIREMIGIQMQILKAMQP